MIKNTKSTGNFLVIDILNLIIICLLSLVICDFLPKNLCSNAFIEYGRK